LRVKLGTRLLQLLKTLFPRPGRKNRNKHDTKYRHLPERHRFAHDYCLMIHDTFVQTLSEGEKADLFNVIIDDPSGSLRKKLQDSKGHDAINAMEENGNHVEVFLLLYKQICAGLISDMAHFLFEALNCSAKGKLTVTYSLLRKPLCENLLYLEYLLSDPAEFVVKFWKDDIDHFGLGQKQVLKPDEIIKTIYQKYPLSRFEEPSFIYEIRYDKTSDQSFQTYFQKATHLVTQGRRYKTENSNFNFAYSGSSQLESYWDGLYSYLPVVLYHAYQVIEALFKVIGKRAGEALDITDQRIAIGYVLWEQFSTWGDFGADKSCERLSEVWDLSRYSCPTCKRAIVSTHDNFLSFYEHGKLGCTYCKASVDLIAPFRELAEQELKAAAKTERS
jgi:hypothetical protein